MLVSVVVPIIILGLYASIALALFLLKRFKAKGFLLIIGVLLFVAARVVEVVSQRGL